MLKRKSLLLMVALLGLSQAELVMAAEFASCVGVQEEGVELNCAVQDRNGNPLNVPERSIGAMYGMGWRLIQVVKSVRDNNQNTKKINVNIFYFDRP